MHKFNDTGIFTGYIKQLLKEFNLPKIKVYTKKYQDYFNKYGVEHPEILGTLVGTGQKVTGDTPKYLYPATIRYIPYIKDGKLQEYIDEEWHVVGFRNHNKMRHEHSYTYGDKLLNYTKNLKVQNNIYDSYTHEYLGDYLRFKRDYLNIDLMPLYNCFSNRVCEKLNLSWKDASSGVTYSFSSNDSNYKIYMLPIKLFQTYTIALDSDQPIELCCGVYGRFQDEREKFQSLPKCTYQKVAYSQFSNPFIYNKTSIDNLAGLLTDPALVELLQNESDLKLFIKLPQNSTSTIVILEGDYLNWNDRGYFKTPYEILDIAFAAESDPIDPPNEEKLLYLNTKSGNIYESVPHEGGRNKFRWLRARKPWNKATTCYTIHTDTETNGVSDLGTLSTAQQNVLLVACFKSYQNSYSSENNKPLTSNSAYYNSTLKKILINPLAGWTSYTNYRVLNLECLTQEAEIKFSSPLQLLQVNTNEQYAFADRLIEYLTENVILPDGEEIYDDIRRVQKVMTWNNGTNNYSISIPGVWDSKMSKVIYEYMTTRDLPKEVKHDLLGYVDKDVERCYQQTKGLKSISILNAELTEEDN